MVKEVRVFSKYTELAMLAFLHCLNIENKLDVVIGHINFNAKHYDKCKLALKFNQLVTIAKLFNKEVVH